MYPSSFHTTSLLEISALSKHSECQFCSGAVKRKTVSLDLWREEKLYVFKSVPTKVCEQCGEKYFSSKVYGIIDRFLKENLKPDETMVVPVLSLKRFVEEAEAVN